ncbi:MAG: hypothetical protein K1W04_01765 [Oscillospiraceae bacterium]
MNHFEYASKKMLSPAKNDLIELIKETQNILRTDFTFQFRFVGSTEHNRVTYDPKTNVGFDFDVNLELNNNSSCFSPKVIRNNFYKALSKLIHNYGYNCVENLTRVIRIKCVDKKKSKVLYSCDFAIVNSYEDEDGHDRQEYIRYNKKRSDCTWEEQSEGYHILPQKEQWIKDNQHQNDLRQLYLRKKNQSNDPNKHSRSLYAEAVHEICQKYGYYD